MESEDVAQLATALKAVTGAPRLALIESTLTLLQRLQELRQQQTLVMDELRFVLEFEREMQKLGLDHKKKWRLVPRGHVHNGSTPRRLVSHTKWVGARPEDVVGAATTEEGATMETVHYFELAIRRHARMRPYQSMGYSSVIEPKGPIFGFGAPPKKEEQE